MISMSPDDSDDPFTRLDGVHILVVDDNMDARTIYKQILLYAGASVLVVGSATAAVRALRHVRPDVVISDLSMPRRDGLWLIDWIRKRDAKRSGHLPVIAVTARDDLYLSTTADRVGFDVYLTVSGGVPSADEPAQGGETVAQFDDGTPATRRIFPQVEHRPFRRCTPLPSSRRMATSMFLPGNSVALMQSMQNAVPGCWPRKRRMACRVPFGRAAASPLGFEPSVARRYVRFVSRQASQRRASTTSAMFPLIVVSRASTRLTGTPLRFEMQGRCR